MLVKFKNPVGKKHWHVLLCFLLLLVGLAGEAWAESSATDRASVESAIIYNILMFVQWPNEDTQPADSSFVLCVDTASPVFAASRQFENKSLRRMKFVVQPVESGVSRCKAIYVDSEVSLKAAATGLGGFSKESLLVISGSRFAMQDLPTIQLFEIDGRLAFNISQKQARQANLQISSKLLRLAKKVIE